MSWNKVSGRQAGAADSAPKEVGRGGYLRASVGLLRADDMPDELARALADQHRGNPLGPHELAGRSGLLQFALFAGPSLIPASASSRSRTARTFSHES
jgi:hypothetical protein